VETFTGMKVQLDKERQAMERLWKEREKQIERVVLNTSGMYGDIRSISGVPNQAMLPIARLTRILPRHHVIEVNREILVRAVDLVHIEHENAE